MGGLPQLWLSLGSPIGFGCLWQTLRKARCRDLRGAEVHDAAVPRVVKLGRIESLGNIWRDQEVWPEGDVGARRRLRYK